MVEGRDGPGGGARAIWWVGAATLGAIVLPLTLGFTLSHVRHAGGDANPVMWAVQIALVATLAVGIAMLVRYRHLAAPGAAQGTSERANHRLLLIAGLLGGLMGLATGIGALRGVPAEGGSALLLTAPLPTWLAVVLALVWGVVLPFISWRWHQVVDEHERQAYRDGAVAGFYALGIGAPVWWLLWRGGLAPQVDAIWLYVTVIAVTGVVWLWRKYR